MTWPTSRGCAREAAAPTMLSAATATSTFLCSKRKGRSWRNVARGPSCCAPRPRRRSVAVRDIEDLVLEGGVAGMSLLSAELLMRRLLGYAQGAGDRLPGVPRQACAAHLRLLGAGDLPADAGESVQLGQRLAVGVGGCCGAGDHDVNIG